MLHKKIVYLSYDGLTDALGESQITPYLVGLSEKGFLITVISTEKRNNFERKKEQITSLLKRKNINWVPLSYTKKPPVLSTLYDVFNIKKTAFKLYKKERFDCVHCRSYITAIVGVMLKKRLGVKFIFDMRGFWADERVDGGIWRLSNPIYKTVYKYFKKMELRFLSEADRVVSLTNNGVKNITESIYPCFDIDKVTVIPCCADLQHFNIIKNSVENRLSMRKVLDIPENAFVLAYLGSLGTWYMTDEMMLFYKTLQTVFYPSAYFLFITRDNPEIVIELTKKYSLPQEQIRIKASERHELPELLSVVDTAVSFIKPVFSKKASSPTKLAELLGMGIPVISNSGVGDIEIYYTSIPQLLVKQFDEESFKSFWETFFSSKKKTKEEFAKIANNYFSLNLGIEKYFETYNNL